MAGEIDDFGDLLEGVMDMLNFKIVPREPGDQGYTPASYLPSEEKVYAVEYMRKEREIERLKAELDAKTREHEQQLEAAKQEIRNDVQAAEKVAQEEKEKVRNLTQALSQQQQQLYDAEKRNREQKTELEKQNKQLSDKEKELDLAVRKLKGLETMESEFQKEKQELVKKQEEMTLKHKTELESIKKVARDHEKNLEESRNLVAKQLIELKKAGDKVIQHASAYENLQEEKLELEKELEKAEDANSEQHDELAAAQEAISNLNAQLKAEVTKSNQYKTESEKCQSTIDAQEVKLTEAEGIIRDLMKVADEGKETGAQLEKILQLNLKLDEKVLNLEGGIRERQDEIDRLQRCLSHERQENSNAQVNYRRLRDSVFNIQQEFSVFIEELKTSNNDGNNPIDESTPQGKLESLSTHIKNKMRWWEENQKLVAEELAKTKKVVTTLSTLLESRRTLAAAPVAPQPLVASSSSATTNNEVPSPPPPPSYRNILVPKPTERKTGINWETSAWPPVQESAANSESSPSAVVRHATDECRLDFGWFCTCGDKNFKSERDLKAHLKLYVKKYEFKCFKCTWRYRKMIGLKRHLLRAHKITISPLKRTCGPCGRTFPSWEKLYQHKMIHTVHRSKMFLRSRQVANRSDESEANGNSSREIIPKISLKKISTGSAWNIVSTNANNDSSMNCESFEENSQEGSVSILSSQDPVSPPPPDMVNDNVNEEESQSNEPCDVADMDAEPEGHSSSIGVPTEGNAEDISPEATQNGVAVQELSSTANTTTTEHGIDDENQAQGFYCKCGRKLSSKENLVQHIRYFTKEWKFKCTLCNYKSFCLIYMKTHYKQTHKMPHFLNQYIRGCSHCGIMFKTINEFVKHRRVKHGAIPWKKREKRTVIPAGTFAVAANIRTRSVTANKKVPPRPSSQKATHEKDISKTGQFECNICEQRFLKLPHLHIHLMRAHNVNKKQLRSKGLKGCRECGKLFRSLQLLRHHRKLAHSKMNDNSSPTESQQPFKRSLVKPTRPPTSETVELPTTSPEPVPIPIKVEPGTEQLHSAAEHVKTDVKHRVDWSKQRSGYFCHCGHEADTKKQLYVHIYYHSKSNHFSCEVCHTSFKTTSRLRGHMRDSHRMDYPLMGCMNCGALFKTKDELKDHRNSQHRRRRKRKVEVVDLTNIPSSSSASNGNPSKEEFMASLQMISRKSPSKRPDKKSLPTISRKIHGVDKSKRHLGYYCQCGAKCSNAVNLSTHISYFTSEWKFKCDLCSKPFFFLSILKHHLAQKHKMTNLTEMNKMGRFGCSQCGQPGFSTHAQLLQHKRDFHSSISPSDSAPPTTRQLNRTSPPKSISESTEEIASSSKTPRRFLNGNFRLSKTTTSAKVNGNVSTRASVIKRTTASGPSPLAVNGIRQQAEPPPPSGPSFVISLRSSDPKSAPAPSTSIKSSPKLYVAPAPPSGPLRRKSQNDQHDVAHGLDADKLKKRLFFCICARKFDTKANLAKHVQWYTNDRKFGCNFCDKRFLGIGYLKAHLTRAHNMHPSHLNLIGCRDCGGTFSSRFEFTQHRIAKHSSPEGNIPNQNVAEPSSSTVISQREEPVASGSKDFLVPRTPSRTMQLRPPSSQSTISTSAGGSSVQQEYPSTSRNGDDEDVIVDAHLTSAPYQAAATHGVDESTVSVGFYCLCGQDFDDEQALDRHVKFYLAQRKFVCKTCGNSFLTATFLRNHMLRVHKIVYNISNACKQCAATFPTNMELYQHFRMVHNHGSPWEPREVKYSPRTPVYQYSFEELQQEPLIETRNEISDTASNATAGQAEVEHGPEDVPPNQDPLSEDGANVNVFSCKCGIGYSSWTALMNHVRVKKAGKIFKCHLCPISFDTHGNLKGHVVKVHGVEYDKGRYACGICGIAFQTCEAMKSHRKQIHGTIR